VISRENAGTTGVDRGTVVGLFRSQADAERAIRELKDAGLHESRLGVAMEDRDGQRELVTGKGGVFGSTGEAWGGALSWGILGGIVGLLAGVGTLVIPGLGPVIAGGALASALADAAIGAGTGGLVGALVGMGIPNNDARYFEQGFRKGGVLVSATAGSRRSEARGILLASGADLGSFVRDEEHYGDRDANAWRGSERRYHDDLGYAGPDRRFSGR